MIRFKSKPFKEVKGEYFIDEIEEEVFGVFHTDIMPGHCFATFCCEQQAQNHADMLNNR